MTEYDYDNLDRLIEETWIDVPAPEPTLVVSTTTQGDTTDEVQQVGINVSGMGFMPGSTFTLTYNGQTTSPGIAYNATAAAVQSALEGLSNLAPGDISVTKSANTSVSQLWNVTFTGPLADANVSQITINSSGVTVMGTKMDVQSTLVAGGVITYEVQAATINNANDGTFTLSLSGQTSNPIAQRCYLIAIGFPGEPVAPFSRSGLNTNANSWTLSAANCSRSRFSKW